MEEYLRKVLEQIRCKKAGPYIEQELRAHMEDQVRENISCGMDQKTAEQEAVKDMGDPVEAGIMLDKVHRPRIAWQMIILVGILSVIGLIIHTLMLSRTESDGSVYDIAVHSSAKYFVFVCLGMAVMTLRFGLQVNGRSAWLNLGITVVSMPAVMLLYVPVYGGILYKYYGKKYRGVLSAVLWMIVPVFLVLRMLSSLVSAFLMLVSMLVMLTAALLKDWFKIKAKRAMAAALWGVFAALPVLLLAAGYFGEFFKSYQLERIRVFLAINGDMHPLKRVLQDAFRNSKMIGTGSIDITGSVDGINADYLLSYLTSTYGLLTGIAVCCIISGLVIYVFLISKKQKNQLGMMMGYGCGMIFFTSLVINVLINAGVLFPTPTFFPFLSASGSYLIVSYALTGIILSIYKYKNVYPNHISVALFRGYTKKPSE